MIYELIEHFYDSTDYYIHTLAELQEIFPDDSATLTNLVPGTRCTVGNCGHRVYCLIDYEL